MALYNSYIIYLPALALVVHMFLGKLSSIHFLFLFLCMRTGISNVIEISRMRPQLLPTYQRGSNGAGAAAP